MASPLTPMRARIAAPLALSCFALSWTSVLCVSMHRAYSCLRECASLCVLCVLLLCLSLSVMRSMRRTSCRPLCLACFARTHEGTPAAHSSHRNKCSFRTPTIPLSLGLGCTAGPLAASNKGEMILRLKLDSKIENRNGIKNHFDF